MNRVMSICVLVFLCISAGAQYIPNNGQAYLLASVYNPSFTGVEDFTDLKLSYRYQWSGYGANAPRFLNLSFNTRLKQPLDLGHNAMRISRPSNIQPHLLPKNKRIIHGFGVNVFQSQFGAIKSAGGSLNYAFNYPLSKKFRFAIGVSSMVESRKIQLEELTFETPDPFYQHLLLSSASQLDLSFRAGVLLYSNGFYLGASYLSVANKSIEAADIAFEEPFYRASFQSGFSVNLSHSVTLKPSTLVYLQTDNGLSADYNVKTYFGEKGWLGLTYRSSQNGIFMLGFNATPLLSAAYSYEISFGGFQQFSDSSHELMLILRFNNFKKLNSRVW